MNTQIQLINSYLLGVIFALLPVTGGLSVYGQSAGIAALCDSEEELPLDYQYYDLACNVNAWEGYFAPDRWKRNVVKAEPAAIVRIEEMDVDEQEKRLVVVGQYREVVETWSIEIPAAGYLSFRLLPARGKSEEPLRVMINDRTDAFERRADGLYYSPFLKAGDKFSLQIPAGETIYHWTNLLFHTNYKAVIVRLGEIDPGRKFVPIEAALIQRIFFLSNEPGTWPTFDQDGDLNSYDDQFELRESDDRFEVDYRDEVEVKDGRFYLLRTFTIREKCSRGNWLKKQRRWVELPIVTE